MIGIIDYNAGNIESVKHAFDSLNIPICISKKPSDLIKADKIVFPGVGNAQYAMNQLSKNGFDSFLRDTVAAGIPILGICLGAQIIFDYSEENDVKCLGLLKGKIQHFSNLLPQTKSTTKNKNHAQLLKIPHMGWNDLHYTADSPLFEGIPKHSDFYFVHSYVIQPQNIQIVKNWTDYGIPVPATVQEGSIFACQFHPEKSGVHGLQILKNFANLNR